MKRKKLTRVMESRSAVTSLGWREDGKEPSGVTAMCCTVVGVGYAQVHLCQQPVTRTPRMAAYY